ncbi:MAG: RNA polymerase sigma factor (sigma-70 family) [Verrucomicrobiales bacterium]|jgi:RNA polymerase sigma factor (sigma-70 family)
MQDHPLLTQFLNSSSSSDFERIIDAHGAMVFGTALRSTRHRALAEEVTQEVFIILGRKAATIREPHKLGAWLHRTSIQCAANANRREAKRRKIMDQYANEFPPSSEVSPKDQAAWQEALPHLDETIDQLQPSDREAVILRFYEKTSFKDIAKLHGKSEDVCRKRVYRALEKLASLLKKRGVLIPPATLGIGMGACLTQDALPMTAGAIAGLALVSPTTAKFITFANCLLAMSSYKLTIVTAAVTALIPIGLQWQANLAHAVSSEAAPAAVLELVPLLGEATRPTTAETGTTRKPSEILAMLQMCAEIRNPYQCVLKIRAFMFSLQREEFPAALEALRDFENQSNHPGVYDGVTALFHHWATQDPETASQMALEGDLKRFHRNMLTGVVTGWIEYDPPALEQFIEDLPQSKNRERLESAQSTYLARLYPEAAADKALGIEDPDKQTERLHRILAQEWDDPTAALQWLENIEPGHRKDGLLQDLLWDLSETQPAEAFARTLESLEGEQRKSTLRGVIQPWTESDAHAAFAALLALPQDSRDGNIIEAFAKSLTDLSTSNQYLEQLSEMPDRIAFISGLAGNLTHDRHDMTSITPDNVAIIRPLVEGMQPGEDRFSARWDMATGWSAIDFEAARDWYYAQPEVSPSMKAKFAEFYQP